MTSTDERVAAHVAAGRLTPGVPAGQPGMITITIRINGTNTNPHRRMGLTRNPFPQIGRAEFDAGERQLASLDGDPIRDEADLRARLAGFGGSFVDLCVAQWAAHPGERISFQVTFPDPQAEHRG